MPIIDCFLFGDELDTLEIRFRELFNVVDRFVLVEATRTHSNQPKPLHFRDNLPRFAKYLSKVTHIAVSDFPTTDTWGMERHQRACIMRGLEGCRDSDIVMVSDCDEIPNAEAIRAYHPNMGIQSFDMTVYYYDMNTRGPDPWYYARIAPYSLVRRVGPNGMRYTIECGLTPGIIPNGGKHLSFFGGVDAIIRKLEAYAHQEYNTPKFKSRERIQGCIDAGTDLFGRAIQFTRCATDLPDVTFLLLVKLDHPDRRTCFQACLGLLRKSFNANISVLELPSPVGLTVKDMCPTPVVYETREDTDPHFHYTKWMNQMIDAAQTPIVVGMNTDVVIKPEQLIESIHAVRNGATFSIPFHLDGWHRMTAAFRDRFAESLDWSLVGDPQYCEGCDTNHVGGIFVANKSVFRGMCGGENEDLVGWAQNDVERLERVERLGYPPHWAKGPIYHLDHWRGEESGAGNWGDGMDELFSQHRARNRQQEEEWLRTRPWFLQGQAQG